MPNRLLRDWTDSKKIDKLSWQEEVFFIRLIMKVDDYGRYKADNVLLKAFLFPRRTELSVDDMERCLSALSAVGLIHIYFFGQERYLVVNNFNQRLRAMRPRYPDPKMADNCQQNADMCQPETNRSEVDLETEFEEDDKNDLKDEVIDSIKRNFKSDSLISAWIRWEKYLFDQFNNSYKSMDSRISAQAQLLKLANKNEERAIEIIEQSISNTWKRFFEIKSNLKDGKQKSNSAGENIGRIPIEKAEQFLKERSSPGSE